MEGQPGETALESQLSLWAISAPSSWRNPGSAGCVLQRTLLVGWEPQRIRYQQLSVMGQELLLGAIMS